MAWKMKVDSQNGTASEESIKQFEEADFQSGMKSMCQFSGIALFVKRVVPCSSGGIWTRLRHADHSHLFIFHTKLK